MQREEFENLPCLACLSEAGRELRARIGQMGVDDFIAQVVVSPVSGLPIQCCKIRTVGGYSL